MKHYIELSYNFIDEGSGTNDNFSSQFSLERDFNNEDLAIFLKLFFYKIPILSADDIDEVIPLEVFSNDNKEDDEIDDWDLLKENENLLAESKKDIDKMVSDNKNLENFKKQIQDNPQMAKEVFKSFLKDTLEN